MGYQCTRADPACRLVQPEPVAGEMTHQYAWRRRSIASEECGLVVVESSEQMCRTWRMVPYLTERGIRSSIKHRKKAHRYDLEGGHAHCQSRCHMDHGVRHV